jgi:hypothetical protein
LGLWQRPAEIACPVPLAHHRLLAGVLHGRVGRQILVHSSFDMRLGTVMKDHASGNLRRGLVVEAGHLPGAEGIWQWRLP